MISDLQKRNTTKQWYLQIDVLDVCMSVKDTLVIYTVVEVLTGVLNFKETLLSIGSHKGISREYPI